jgi:ATP-dependent exoDNAse (exonuclease V) alpha subunit
MFTAESLAELKANQYSKRELEFAFMAIEIAKQCKIFEENSSNWDAVRSEGVSKSSQEEVARLTAWKDSMKKEVERQNSRCDSRPDCLDQEPSVEPLMISNNNQSGARNSFNLGAEAPLHAADVEELNKEQRRAFDIVTWHLDQTQKNGNPPPLRMILYGEGGTGKSKVIQTITEAFIEHNVKTMLVKAAFTGTAASLIEGKTTHSVANISVHGDKPITDETRAKLQKFWGPIRYLIIDEYSMISKTFLSQLSRNISVGKQGSESRLDDGMSFGGINVILCGDLHQFPPVAKAPYEALYHPFKTSYEKIEVQLGRKIYEEFSTVVVLKEQIRVTDIGWRDFLRRLRAGQVTKEDVQMLKSLILEQHQSAEAEQQNRNWIDAPLVTSRHAVRTRWNEEAARRACKINKEQLFVCTAQDRIKGKPLTSPEEHALAARTNKKWDRRKSDLPEIVELAVGTKVMVTSNLQTDLDITNGARGEIVGIVHNEKEDPLASEAIHVLQNMPAYILIKLARTRMTALPGLPEGVIPVEPITVNIQITVKENGKTVRRNVQRTQFPITGAYACTDYRSQGQSMPIVLVDIQSPPEGPLSLFSLYVMLSRSSGRSTIRLLRNFDEKIFLQSHDLDLTAEDDRLMDLDEKTNVWWTRIQGEMN